MSELHEFQPKVVNMVWIGTNPVNALGAFNAASWLLCGWNVNLFRHVPPGGVPGPTFAADLEGPVLEAASAGGAEFRIIQLADLLTGDASKVMPVTAEVIRPWLEDRLEGHLPYVVGDISKAFIAGTQYGMVLDTKIGPSPWVHRYPSGPFEKFICASRSGGAVVENQCMGSFDMDRSYAYARLYDPKPKSTFKDVDLRSVGHAQAIFGGLTNMHASTYSALAPKGNMGGAANALNITTLDVSWPEGFQVPGSLKFKAPYTFTELQVASYKVSFQNPDELEQFIRKDGKGAPQDNRGPFRVYQVANYYNWSQGEYAQQKMSNDASVARTLVLEHVNNREGRDLPEPFRSFGQRYPILEAMVPAVIASLSIWREDKKT